MNDPQTSGPLSQSVERLRREFERWLDSAMQQGNRALDVVGLRGADRPWTPAVDLIETPTEVLVDVDLPGIDPVLVDVSLTGNMLTVQGPKRTHIPPQGGTVHVAERMQGPFQRDPHAHSRHRRQRLGRNQERRAENPADEVGESAGDEDHRPRRALPDQAARFARAGGSRTLTDRRDCNPLAEAHGLPTVGFVVCRPLRQLIDRFGPRS